MMKLILLEQVYSRNGNIEIVVGALQTYGTGRKNTKIDRNSVIMLNNLKENGKKCFPLSGNYYLLNISPCPAVIVECGFLSNVEDERLLSSDAWQGDLAKTLADGVMGYFFDIAA